MKNEDYFTESAPPVDDGSYEAAALYIVKVNDLLEKARRHSAGCIVTRVHALLYLSELNAIKSPGFWSCNDAYDRAVASLKAMISPGHESTMESLVQL